MVAVKKKCLLLGGADTPWHQFTEYRDNYLELIESAGYEAAASEDMNCLNASFLQDISVIFCCASERVISKQQEQDLLSAVAGFDPQKTGLPKTFIGVHSASANFLNSDKYLRMLGGKFLAHPPIGDIDVRRTGPDSLLDGIDDFRINDEFYLMEYYPPFTVLLEADYKGLSHPLCWKKSYGLGCVYYLAPGHGKEQISHPAVKRILLNMLKKNLHQET